MNLSSSTTKRSWVPDPISPAASLTDTLKTSLLRSISTSSVSQVTSMPTGVAEECATSRRVPTVLDPPSRCGATLPLAVASMSAIMAGVANTGRDPLPTAMAVLSSVTGTVLVPLMPVVSMDGWKRGSD